MSTYTVPTVTPKQRTGRKRIHGEDVRQRIETLTKAGMSQRDIADELDMSPMTVRNIQAERGLTVKRTPKCVAVERATAAAKKLGYDSLDEALTGLAKECSGIVMASRLGISQNVVYVWLRERGIVPYQPKGAHKPVPQPSVVVEDVPRRAPIPRAEVPAWVEAVPLDLVPLDVARFVKLVPGMEWCANCFDDIQRGQECMHCGCREFVAARDVLLPEEWVER
jgi:hypothetical protein